MGVATKMGRRRPGHEIWLWESLMTPPLPTGRSQAGMRSIMEQREEPSDSEAHRRSLQFVGVNGG